MCDDAKVRVRIKCRSFELETLGMYKYPTTPPSARAACVRRTSGETHVEELRASSCVYIIAKFGATAVVQLRAYSELASMGVRS